MAHDDESFLARWARRKQHRERDAGAEADRTGKAAADAPAPEAAADPEAAQAAEARRRDLVESLPDPDTLGPDDDFAQFLQDGVPEQLRQRALRRLWLSDPVFANLDRLVDYDLDYTDAATVVENLKTAYKVGRGMIDDTAASEAGTAEAPADAQAAAESPGETADAGAAPASDPTESEPPAEAPDDVSEAAQDPGDTTAAQTSDAPAQPRRPRGQAARRRWGGDAA